MKIKDINNYNFHDSGILEISKNDGFVSLKIMYCLFMQEDYVDGNPENSIIKVTFKNVTNYVNSHNTFNDDTILEVEVNNNCVKFVVEDNNRDVYNIIIEADTFDFETIEVVNQ